MYKNQTTMSHPRMLLVAMRTWYSFANSARVEFEPSIGKPKTVGMVWFLAGDGNLARFIVQLVFV